MIDISINKLTKHSCFTDNLPIFCILQGQSLYMSKDLDQFYPVVYGADITATDADENDAR